MDRHQDGSEQVGMAEPDDVVRRGFGGRGGQASDLDQPDDSAEFPGIGQPGDPDIDSGQVRDDEGLFTPIREPGPERSWSGDDDR